MSASRDVQIAAEQQLAPALGHPGRVPRERLEEADLGGIVLAAVGHVDGRQGDVAHLRRHDAVLQVELGVREGGPLGREVAAHVEGDAGVAAAPVPVAPVALGLEQHRRDLLRLGLDLLKADGVGFLPRDPLADLRFARTNPVDVPRRDLHRRSVSGLGLFQALQQLCASRFERVPPGLTRRLAQEVVDPRQRELEGPAARGFGGMTPGRSALRTSPRPPGHAPCRRRRPPRSFPILVPRSKPTPNGADPARRDPRTGCTLRAGNPTRCPRSRCARSARTGSRRARARSG